MEYTRSNIPFAILLSSVIIQNPCPNIFLNAESASDEIFFRTSISLVSSVFFYENFFFDFFRKNWRNLIFNAESEYDHGFFGYHQFF
jgi:hypothetical protein